MLEEKTINELYAMQDAVMIMFRRLAQREEGESEFTVLADLSNQIQNEIDICFREMQEADRMGCL